MKIRPRNWREFQHYKNRNPPWIRLHRSLLDNRDFHCLPVASRALAPMLWLLASEVVGGEIDASAANLAFRLRMSEKEVSTALKPLIDAKFFEVVQEDSEMLAECLRDADSETETETETETDARKRVVAPIVDGLHVESWDRWVDYRVKIRKPLKPVSMPAAQRELAAFGSDQAAVVEQSIANGWQGLFALKQSPKKQGKSEWM